MSTRRLLATLVVGARHRRLWHERAERSWTDYARRWNVPLLVLDEALDVSERARRRSVAWQKCLLSRHPRVREADQVLWFDSDIVVNRAAPDVFAAVPLANIGAVDAWGYPSHEVFRRYLAAEYARMTTAGVPFIANLTPREFYERYSLPNPPEHVIQTGLFVFSPWHHEAILTHVYEAYEEKGGPEWNYEMRPLSYEIVRRTAVTWLDPRFNAMWGYERDVTNATAMRLRPFERSLRRAARRLGLRYAPRRQRQCVRDALARSFFLHFAGCAEDMELLPRTGNVPFDGARSAAK